MTHLQSLTLTWYPKTFPFSVSIQTPRINKIPILRSQQPARENDTAYKNDKEGIPNDEVRVIAKFKSRHNYIRVVEVSRAADHPFAGSRLLLLDRPGNIHSINFLHPKRSILTQTYFDVFATFPPLLPPGPVALLGLGAASAARPLLRLYPSLYLHAWEIDPAVVSVARRFFDLAALEREFPDRLSVYVGDALHASVRGGFAGVAVDLFTRGSLLPELQDADTWRALARCLRKDGRVMVNVGGSCVEAEEPGRDGRALMEETLAAMAVAFGDDKVSVLGLGNGKDDSSVALTGDFPDPEEWKQKLPKSFRDYVDMWAPLRG